MTGDSTWDTALVFGLGLVLGSFVNVIIHRLPLMILATSVADDEAPRYDLSWPASHCTHCHTPLKVWHNIPVLSYVWLKGRCDFCQHAISWRYPLIEIATALIWLACTWHWGINAAGFCWAGFATSLLALSVIDWQTTLLPDDLTQALVWAGLVASAVGWLALPLTQSVWGAVVGYVSLWSIATLFERITGKQGMGAGDFKLLAGLGAWLGPLALLPVVMAASMGGAIVGLALKFSHRLREDGYVPFGPFLAIAGMAVAVIGMDDIALWMGWYFFA
jgi:leader peptidase (prepilin peptidase)/N-methyltransferase